MTLHHHRASCRYCAGTGRITVSRTIMPGRRRFYRLPCNVVTRAQVDAERPRSRRWIGWTAFAAASIAAGVAVTPATTLFAAVLR